MYIKWIWILVQNPTLRVYECNWILIAQSSSRVVCVYAISIIQLLWRLDIMNVIWLWCKGRQLIKKDIWSTNEKQVPGASDSDKSAPTDSQYYILGRVEWVSVRENEFGRTPQSFPLATKPTPCAHHTMRKGSLCIFVNIYSQRNEQNDDDNFYCSIRHNVINYTRSYTLLRTNYRLPVKGIILLAQDM